MGRSHGPREPRRRTPVWQPEPLHIPAEPPARRIRQPDDAVETDESEGGDDDRPGSHVIVIDLA